MADTTKDQNNRVGPDNSNKDNQVEKRQSQFDANQAVQDYAAQVSADREVRQGYKEILGQAPQESAPKVAQTATAADMPVPGGFFTSSADSGRTLTSPEEILASVAIPHLARPYMAYADAITADANGDKILYEGTVMSLVDGSDYLVEPATVAADAIGVNNFRCNLRDGNYEISVIQQGVLREDRLTFNGTYVGLGGTLNAGVKTALPFIHFQQQG